MMQAPNPAGIPEMDVPGMIAFLNTRGYTVRKARTAKQRQSLAINAFLGKAETGRTKARATGKQHGQCIEHYRIVGFAKPVCVLGERKVVDGATLPAQSADEVITFAESIAAIAARAGDPLVRIRARMAAERAA